MSLDITDPIAVEHDALDKIHAALAQHPDGLTIGKLADETGYGSAYLKRLLVAPYFEQRGYRWRHDPASVDESLLEYFAERLAP